MNLQEQIESAIEELVYPSARSAKFSLLTQKKLPVGRTMVEPFTAFFARLTHCEAWFDENQFRRAGQFKDLRDLLRANLSDPVVLQIFKTATESEIFVFGVDDAGAVVGIKTVAVGF